ncbi:NADH-quinone oxidoreductase subunit J [Bdellovibrio bacteriovorus]|uniref:NADH-quinone oxidoreductase subunit J n=2 Tax=Bdellovibrio bacteriovorus TaxID=959 RepID=Q6MGN4_BDEBA|nr:NADH-quinone oxidoreductase subunit J [Bdellovibrio bacteriovorus]AFY03429.1 NADH dehydrogenase I chain J [Bdellovibrio bacteriovorus str. Tiberius]CAE81245.1 NADH dehydrogenase I chain J [Bdellovibrio bacteriovorus HD100]
MTADAFLFWFLAFVTLASGLSVILMSNPIYSALCLAMTMVGISALFVTLNAYFIAGVQLIVYAGAVMVLFTMVIMLFDLKKDVQAFTRGKFTGVVKIASVGLFAGLVVGAIAMSVNLMGEKTTDNPVLVGTGMESTKALGQILFTKYIFGFEALGVLLLVIAVGAVALARSKGGTHEH